MVAVIGFALSVNANMCQLAGNVQETIVERLNDRVTYTLNNRNDFRVNVHIVVVYRGQTVSNTQTIVVEPGATTRPQTIFHWAEPANRNHLSLRKQVVRCG